MAKRAATIYWDIYDEHLREAAFLWESWESAMQSANYNLVEVMQGPEERLHAHLDALSIAPRAVHERLLLAAMEESDPATLSAATWALATPAFAPAVLQHLHVKKGAAKVAIAQAIALSSDPGATHYVESLWPSADASERAVLLDVAATRQSAWLSDDILRASLDSHDPELCGAALRALRSSPQRALMPAVQRALEADDACVRCEAITTGLVVGLPSAWAALTQELQLSAARPELRWLLSLLALHPEKSKRQPIYAALSTPQRPAALWALGFVGEVESADVLVSALQAPEDARIAADSLAAISGMTIEGSLRQTQPPAAEQDPDEPLRLPEPADNLPQPNAAALTSWWKTARSALSEQQRYVYGAPNQPSAVLRALLRCGMWRNDVYAVWLAQHMRGAWRPTKPCWATQQHARVRQELRAAQT